MGTQATYQTGLLLHVLFFLLFFFLSMIVFQNMNWRRVVWFTLLFFIIENKILELFLEPRGFWRGFSNEVSLNNLCCISFIFWSWNIYPWHIFNIHYITFFVIQPGPAQPVMRQSPKAPHEKRPPFFLTNKTLLFVEILAKTIRLNY